METKHTPGPWKLIKTDRNDIVVSYSDGGLRSHIATCHNQLLCEEHGNLLANARLIAAAPDMLEALKAIFNYDWHDELNELHGEDETNEAKVLKQVRAAIARAEGKE
jgi:hypothetical protein